MLQVYEFVRDMQKDQDADSVSLTSESSFGGQSDIDDDDEDAGIVTFCSEASSLRPNIFVRFLQISKYLSLNHS